MRRRPGFTLIELLVVIGIVALLASILISGISRFRNQARQTLCLNNMRQIGTALLAYARANNDNFPRPATNDDRKAEDWIYWGDNNRQPDKGKIVEFLGGRFDPNLFTCPSDELANHLTTAKGAPYPYSYSVNDLICARATGNPIPQTMSLLQIINLPTKILLIDESDKTIDDGAWSPGKAGDPKSNPNLLTTRHDVRDATPTNPYPGQSNVVFCDGHSEAIGRMNLVDPANRIWDPRFRP